MFEDMMVMYEKGKYELSSFWNSIDSVKIAAQASDAIKTAAGTPENANMVKSIEESRSRNAPVQLEAGIFEDTTADTSVDVGMDAREAAYVNPAESTAFIAEEDTGMDSRESAYARHEETLRQSLTGWENLAGSESADLHVDPLGIVTMGWGVVPDGGVKLDGRSIKVKEGHGLTATSDLSKVDTSKAWKKVNGTKYKRENYLSDETFSKAIYSAFYESAEENVANFDSLEDEHKEVVVDLGYNAGEGAFEWNDVDTLTNELVKDVSERTITNLTQFTDNFAAGGMFGGGVLRRRAISANKVLGDTDQIAYIEQGDDVSGTTKFTLKRSDGTTVREWGKRTATVDAYPEGTPILTIDGERRASY